MDVAVDHLEGQQAVHRERVQVLEPVPGPPFLQVAPAQHAARLDVRVHLLHVRVGVMEDVVLVLPDHLAGPDEARGGAGQPVDRPVAGVAAVGAFVHQVEADERERLGQGEGGDDRGEDVRGEEDQEDVGNGEPGQDDRGLGQHAPAARPPGPDAGETLIHALFQRRIEAHVLVEGDLPVGGLRRVRRHGFSLSVSGLRICENLPAEEGVGRMR